MASLRASALTRTVLRRVACVGVTFTATLSCGGVAAPMSDAVEAGAAPPDAQDVYAEPARDVAADPIADEGGSEPAKCDDGMFQPAVVATGQDIPYAAILDAGQLLWLNYHPSVEPGWTGGDIWQGSMKGGDAKLLWTAEKSQYAWRLRGLAVDDTFAYSAIGSLWGSAHYGILRVRRDGTDSSTWIPPQSGCATISYEVIGATADSIYWRECGWIKRASKGYGIPIKLIMDESVLSALVDAAVLWLVRCPAGCSIERYTSGSTSPDLVVDAGPAHGLAHDETALYWVDEKQHRIDTMSKAGGAIATLVESVPKCANPPAVNATHLFWSNGAGRILAMPKTGGAAITLACTHSYASAIVADDDYVYWGQAATYPSTTSGSIERVPAP